jgi:hypothetical protein
VPPRYARGRRPVTSPRAQAVGTQSGKKSLQARFFAAASPAASALAGFPPKRLTRINWNVEKFTSQIGAFLKFWKKIEKILQNVNLFTNDIFNK